MKHQTAVRIWVHACEQEDGDGETTNSTFLGGVATERGLETSNLKQKEKKDIASFLREWADAIEAE